ncbi:MAG: hypothetical protein BWZ10_00537 [candidate division BRC1 bacterium ADurb.BinA364]|nr:MAG: hypothetical protein BWZ10_00537 [candidate division BRC1 bacterium ADurb.BinA364]
MHPLAGWFSGAAPRIGMGAPAAFSRFAPPPAVSPGGHIVETPHPTMRKDRQTCPTRTNT